MDESNEDIVNDREKSESDRRRAAHTEIPEEPVHLARSDSSGNRVGLRADSSPGQARAGRDRCARAAA